jgi:FtsZ-interacting cell division protein ZipA
MNTIALIVVGVVAVGAAVVVWWLVTRRERSEALRDKFGPEYERTVQERGTRREAERVLEARAERVDRLDIRELAADERQRCADDWRAVQSHFVDNPELAIAEADHLVAEVMQTRGYPMGNFDQRAADVSVDHPRVVENYRAAHAIAGRSARGDASTEDLRQAMVHYRALFDDLIGAHDRAAQEVRR